ncbi:MAG: hypothetical protein VKK59_01270 [Vampirovibrionales bacterium]|nr:hypothetical protein [Vampirovibrionales bacterium]
MSRTPVQMSYPGNANDMVATPSSIAPPPPRRTITLLDRAIAFRTGAFTFNANLLQQWPDHKPIPKMYQAAIIEKLAEFEDLNAKRARVAGSYFRRTFENGISAPIIISRTILKLLGKWRLAKNLATDSVREFYLKPFRQLHLDRLNPNSPINARYFSTLLKKYIDASNVANLSNEKQIGESMAAITADKLKSNPRE